MAVLIDTNIIWTIRPYVLLGEKTMEETAQQNEKLSNAKFLRCFKPQIQAMRDLGGSATPKEACSKIIENEQVSEIKNKD